jgi:hypothetical protein
MDDVENDPNAAMGRQPRSRRPRPGGSSTSMASGGREREFTNKQTSEFTGNNGMTNGATSMTSAVSGAASEASKATEDTEALLRKLRNL